MNGFFAFLTGLFWPAAAAAVAFFVLAVIFLAAFCAARKNEKRARKEADAARDLDLTEYIDGLLLTISTSKAWCDARSYELSASVPHTYPDDFYSASFRASALLRECCLNIVSNCQ